MRGSRVTGDGWTGNTLLPLPQGEGEKILQKNSMPPMTPLWSARDLVEATGGAMAVDFAASGVSIDTRTIAPGDLFVALDGEAGDGHTFVLDALAKGAAGAMVHHDLALDIPGAARLLRVDDTL